MNKILIVTAMAASVYYFRWKILSYFVRNDVQYYNHYIIIHYTTMGQQYKIRVPYDSEMSVLMNDYMITAINDDEEFDLENQPGIPILLNAAELGVDKIKFTNLDDNTETFFEEVPYYGNIF